MSAPPSSGRSGAGESCSACRGGIAAYKAVEICRRLVDAGAFVSPVLTEDATRFIGALTFSALGLRAGADVALRRARDPIPHTRLGQTADLSSSRPATAKLLGQVRRRASPTTS